MLNSINFYLQPKKYNWALFHICEFRKKNIDAFIVRKNFCLRNQNRIFEKQQKIEKLRGNERNIWRKEVGWPTTRFFWAQPEIERSAQLAFADCIDACKPISTGAMHEGQVKDL